MKHFPTSMSHLTFACHLCPTFKVLVSSLDAVKQLNQFSDALDFKNQFSTHKSQIILCLRDLSEFEVNSLNARIGKSVMIRELDYWNSKYGRIWFKPQVA